MIEKNNRKNKGFTLVELLIVLVIIAILAAIIIPVTLSIVDSTDEVQIATDAKNIWNSVQTCMLEQQANNKNYLKKASESVDANNKGVPMNEKEMDEDHNKIEAKFDGSFAFDFSSYELASRMLKKIDNVDEMKFIYFASGRFVKYYLDEDNMDKAYTTYLVIFQYKDDDTTYYYDGKNLKEDWPLNTPDSIEGLTAGSELFMTSNGQNISIQLYCIKKLDKNGKNDTSKAIAYLKKNIKTS